MLGKKKAFTLMEIMIAILVFSIGILAVLRVITGNLSVMDYTNRKLQSTVLAKEGLELLYNVRDSNLEKNLSWNCVMSPYVLTWTEDVLTSMINNANANNSLSSFESVICSDHFGVNKLLQLSFNNNYYIIQNTKNKVDDFDILFESNKLCLYKDLEQNMSRYAYCDDFEGGEETFFARYLSFSPIDFDDEIKDKESDIKGKPNTYSLNTEPKILKVESHVLYRKGGKTGDVVFESFIGNY